MTDETAPKSARATIKDVAKAAGVSAMTVSNVVNGHLQYVSPATRKRVEKEIARLQYRRQANARNLRTAEHRSIGMIIVDESPFFLADHFTCQVVAGLANVLNRQDYTLTVQGMPGDQLSRSMIMRDQGVDGYCAMISGTPEERRTIVEQLKTLNQPVIVFQEAIEETPQDFCVVRQDDRGGGRLIADHLVARRVEDYLLIVPHQGWPAIENRVAGLREALSATAPDARIVTLESGSESFPDVQAALEAYLAKNPLPGAVIGANDVIAAAALSLLVEKGHRLPEDVRVVGFNGFEAHRYTNPTLTTVLSAPYAIGEQAGRAMLERLSAGRFAASEFVLPVIFAPHSTT